jgi:release factor glutamine methyltransferase
MASPDLSPARTVDQALAAGRALGLDRLDVRLLVAWALGRTPTWVLAHGDAVLDAEVADRLADALQRRADAVPLAYLVGRREFHGLDLAVDARVLDPRPDTETLVDWALEHLAALHPPGPPGSPGPTVVDLGTGSGAVALALARARPDARVWAVDRSRGALAVAAANARRLGLPVHILHGDWWRDWALFGPDGAPAPSRFDLAVSNPPYLAVDDPHLPALRHEPREALVAGDDGLEAYRTLVAGAAAHLRSGGALLLEHGHDQAQAVELLLAAAGGRPLPGRHDLGGHRRCSGAVWPADSELHRSADAADPPHPGSIPAA